MKLSTRGRYAVMAMADIGVYGRQQTPVSLTDIAERQEISLSYLEQLFGKLRRAGGLSIEFYPVDNHSRRAYFQ